MRVVEGQQVTHPLVRADLIQGDVFRYLDPKAKPGLRMVCETPEGKEGLYSVKLETGALMHSKAGSDSAERWPVELVEGAFVEGYDF